MRQARPGQARACGIDECTGVYILETGCMQVTLQPSVHTYTHMLMPVTGRACEARPGQGSRGGGGCLHYPAAQTSSVKAVGTAWLASMDVEHVHCSVTAMPCASKPQSTAVCTPPCVSTCRVQTQGQPAYIWSGHLHLFIIQVWHSLTSPHCCMRLPACSSASGICGQDPAGEKGVDLLPLLWWMAHRGRDKEEHACMYACQRL